MLITSSFATAERPPKAYTSRGRTAQVEPGSVESNSKREVPAGQAGGIYFATSANSGIRQIGDHALSGQLALRAGESAVSSWASNNVRR